MTATGKLQQASNCVRRSATFCREGRVMANSLVVIPGRSEASNPVRIAHRDLGFRVWSFGPSRNDGGMPTVARIHQGHRQRRFKANRDGLLALIERVRALEERAARAASAGAKDRFPNAGQLLPRERVALVLDPGAPFIELFDARRLHVRRAGRADKSVPGGGLVAGIGFVSGIRCMVSANDAGIDAGALSPRPRQDAPRAGTGAGGTSCPTCNWSRAPVPFAALAASRISSAAATFRNLARLSAAGLPVVTVTRLAHRRQAVPTRPGLSDYIVMVRGRTRAFLAGRRC